MSKQEILWIATNSCWTKTARLFHFPGISISRFAFSSPAPVGHPLPEDHPPGPAFHWLPRRQEGTCQVCFPPYTDKDSDLFMIQTKCCEWLLLFHWVCICCRVYHSLYFFSYTKIVNKGMTKAEMILKVIHLFYISFQQWTVIPTIKSECIMAVP